MKVAAALLCLLLAVPARAGQTALEAGQVAAKMAALLEDGDSSARVRMKDSGGRVLQVQIKSRRAGGSAQTAYEILWPQDRKGEKVVLRQTPGSWPQGEIVGAGGQRSPVGRDEWHGGIFGTGLALADAVEDFFLWPKQTLAGRETIGRTDCVILESRPGVDSPHGKVRSWIDTGKWIALRVEKYDREGKLRRTITTTRVARDDKGRHVPAGMTVAADDGSLTEIDGSQIRHDVSHDKADFAF
ncbi:MAG: outer membrane lipoprotein-sorting protein [Chthoniobacterales bacterium]